MKKILYIEDEIVKNIELIINIFEKFIGKELIKQIKLLKDDESGYGISAKEIKEIINKSEIVEIVDNFKDALDIFECKSDDYSVFIVDRNLSEQAYNLKDLTAIDKNFNEQMLSKYKSCEGDYLLEKIFNKTTNILTKFYFLSANSPSELKFKTSNIENHIEQKRFSYDNFIEKTETKKVVKIMNDNKLLTIQLENKDFLLILKNQINYSVESKFLDLFFEKDIEKSLALVRIIFETMLQTIQNKHTIVSVVKNTFMSDFIYAIENKNQNPPYIPQYNILNSSELIVSLLRNIKSITSAYGSHSTISKVGYMPSENTKISLIFALKEIILWFDKII